MADLPRRRTFSSLRVYNFRLFFVGQAISVIGNWMQNVGLSWLVLQVSGSGTALGVFTGLRFLPLLILGPWGGMLADRYNKRVLLYVTQSFAALVSVALTVVALLDVTQLWLIFLLGALLGLGNVVDNPARQAMIYELVETGDLTSAISLTSVVGNLARIVGPVIAGVLLAVSGVTLCFAINVLTYVIVLITLRMMRRSQMRPSVTVAKAPGQIREGFRYVLHEPALALPLLMVGVSGAFAWEFQVTLPLLASETFDGEASLYGLMLAMTGVGAIIGGLITARRPSVTTSVVAWSAVGWGASIIITAAAPTLLLALGSLLLVGAGLIAVNSLSKVCLQLSARPDMRGRVMSLWSIAWQGTTTIGAPIVGWIGQTFGARWSLVAGGVPTVLVGVLCLWILWRRGRGPATNFRPVTVGT